jgi:shikimate kinase
MSVAEIFRASGEEAFRRFESLALQRALSHSSAVIATGGGAACNQENLDRMLATGHVVVLTASVPEILRRTGRSSGRPLLDGATDPVARATALLASRESFYRQAHVSVATDGRTIEATAGEILSALSGKGEVLT